MFALPLSQVCNDTYVSVSGPSPCVTYFTHTSAHIYYNNITWAPNSLPSPEAVLQFTESDYSNVEGLGIISLSVQLNTNIGTDLTVVAVPVNYTFLNDSQSPILDVIPDIPNYDPRRPINATSK